MSASSSQKNVFDVDKMVAREIRHSIHRVAIGSFHAFDRHKRSIFHIVTGDYSRASLI